VQQWKKLSKSDIFTAKTITDQTPTMKQPYTLNPVQLQESSRWSYKHNHPKSQTPEDPSSDITINCNFQQTYQLLTAWTTKYQDITEKIKSLDPPMDKRE
jgi:hypothetical protein